MGAVPADSGMVTATVAVVPFSSRDEWEGGIRPFGARTVAAHQQPENFPAVLKEDVRLHSILSWLSVHLSLPVVDMVRRTPAIPHCLHAESALAEPG
jgi:hypothetical protein